MSNLMKMTKCSDFILNIRTSKGDKTPWMIGSKDQIIVVCIHFL